jgi:hypothetical protein
MDCFDQEASSYPGAPELCDGLDNDCNGQADDGLTFTFYYEDADGDGFGTANSKVTSCAAAPPAGFVTNNLDCDDIQSGVYPGAPEVCDNLDNNCNDLIDEGLPGNTFYLDADGDGDGDAASATSTCFPSAPLGYVANSNDCDDTNPTINTLAVEICDELDNNCDGQVDEALPQFFYYADTDGDGFGGTLIVVSTCSNTPLPGFSENNLDCDDINAAINPNAIEVIDGIDNNCDGSVGTSNLNVWVKTYPNPVLDVLNISINDLDGAADVQISNMEGKVLISRILGFADGRALLSFVGLLQGVYLLRIAEVSGRRNWVQRVVKM